MDDKNSVNQSQKHSSGVAELSPRPALACSPLPWHNALRDSTMLVAFDQARVADCSVAIGMSREEAEANAELIVRAVNNHDDLVEALSCSLDDFRSLSKEPSAKAARMRAQKAYQGVRAALAKVNKPKQISE